MTPQQEKSSNDYHFITRWDVPATCEAVFDILTNTESLSRWWPSVYLDVQQLEPGDENGLGSVFSLYTKGWLPYTLRWSFTTTKLIRPSRIALEASGDLVGRGTWTLNQAGDIAAITYNWHVSAEKGLLRNLSFLMRPIFGANHRWAMDKGEESLRLELLRRQARSDAERSAVPAPPGPTFVRRSSTATSD